ncbi:CPBP family glutamic-type intramembrane protease [Melioribacter sp. OK-6-Me]|uniref:CPBP family glutamic-type intramembrane protease n=1 Tax=unclassified Melioribacter TaxID=2627329 RepID=UPI003ED89288
MDEERNSLHKENDDKEQKIKISITPVGAALLGLALVFVLYQFGGALLTLLIFGFDVDKADVNAVRLLTAGGQILLILLPSLLLAKFIYTDVTSILKFKFPEKKEVFLFIIGMIIITPLLQNYLYIQNYFITKAAENYGAIKSIKQIVDQLDKLLESAYGSLLVSNSFFESSLIVFIIAVIPAICEEVFFRGYVISSFQLKYSPFLSALITGLFFGIYHFNPYGLIPLIVLGTYFGFAAYKSESIFVPMALHFLNNFFAVTAYLILGEQELISSNVVPEKDISIYLISFVVLVILFAAFVFYVNRMYKLKEEQKEGEL